MATKTKGEKDSNGERQIDTNQAPAVEADVDLRPARPSAPGGDLGDVGEQQGVEPVQRSTGKPGNLGGRRR